MLGRDHPALGAFRKKRPKPPDWKFIATELAHELRRQTGHMDVCTCTSCLALNVYDEAIRRSEP